MNLAVFKTRTYSVTQRCGSHTCSRTEFSYDSIKRFCRERNVVRIANTGDLCCECYVGIGHVAIVSALSTPQN